MPLHPEDCGNKHNPFLNSHYIYIYVCIHRIHLYTNISSMSQIPNILFTNKSPYVTDAFSRWTGYYHRLSDLKMQYDFIMIYAMAIKYEGQNAYSSNRNQGMEFCDKRNLTLHAHIVKFLNTKINWNGKNVRNCAL